MRLPRPLRHLLAAVPLAIALSTAHAQSVPSPVAVDAVGDFLPTYTGPRGADLDVLTAVTFYDAAKATFTFNATMAGRIGTTADAVYVWGVNRGAGTAGLARVAPGVLFDSVLVVANGGIQAFIDLTSGAFTPLAPGAVQIAGNTLSVDIAASVLAPTTFNAVAPGSTTWNLWPRHTFNPANDADISDFAPDNSNLGVLSVSSVPEPAPGLCAALGLPLLWLSLRRRQQAQRQG